MKPTICVIKTVFVHFHNLFGIKLKLTWTNEIHKRLKWPEVSSFKSFSKGLPYTKTQNLTLVSEIFSKLHVNGKFIHRSENKTTFIYDV